MSPTPGARGVSPVVGTLLLVALVVCFAAIIAVAFGSMPIVSSGPDAAFLMGVSAEGEIELNHVAGDSIDVAELSMTISVGGESLEYPLEIPFNGNEGFSGAASGPFHPDSSSNWTTGENASAKVAGTNDPEIESGDRVTVTLAVDGETIAREEAQAG